MRVTILDVAKRAGVSHTTVSWAIHDRPEISAETKEKVFKAIKELDYHPNYLARSLVKGKTNTIAIVATFFSSTFEMEILKGIEQSINSMKSKYTITLFSTMGQHEKVLSDIVYSKRADGVILMSIGVSEKIVELYKSNGVPLMVIDEDAPGALEVKLDNFKGAYVATEHLIKSGRKNLAIVLGDGNYVKLFKDPKVLNSLGITFKFALMSIPLSILAGFFLACLLNTKIRLMNFWRTLFYLPAMISGVVVAMLWRGLFDDQYGIINYLLRSVGLKGTRLYQRLQVRGMGTLLRRGFP